MAGPVDEFDEVEGVEDPFKKAMLQQFAAQDKRMGQTNKALLRSSSSQPVGASLQHRMSSAPSGPLAAHRPSISQDGPVRLSVAMSRRATMQAATAASEAGAPGRVSDHAAAASAAAEEKQQQTMDEVDADPEFLDLEEVQQAALVNREIYHKAGHDAGVSTMTSSAKTSNEATPREEAAVGSAAVAAAAPLQEEILCRPHPPSSPPPQQQLVQGVSTQQSARSPRPMQRRSSTGEGAAGPLAAGALQGEAVSLAARRSSSAGGIHAQAAASPAPAAAAVGGPVARRTSSRAASDCGSAAPSPSPGVRVSDAGGNYRRMTWGSQAEMDVLGGPGSRRASEATAGREAVRMSLAEIHASSGVALAPMSRALSSRRLTR